MMPDIAHYEGCRVTAYCEQVVNSGRMEVKMKGLYSNIHAKRARISAGSGEKMRSPGDPGAPTAKAFRESAKTATSILRPEKNPGTKRLKG